MDKDDSSQRDSLTRKQISLIGAGIIVALMGIVLLAKKPVYDCSKVDQVKLQQTFMACETARKEIEIFKINDLRKDEYLKFSKEKEENRHCEEMAKSGKSCEKLNTLFVRARDPYPPCENQSKELLCEPHMFLWKLWYL